MGTRGAYGYYSKGVTKVTYNHFDSYPEELGYSMLKYCETVPLEEMKEVFERIRLVQGEKPISDYKDVFDLGTLKKVLGIKKQSNDWYWFLRDTQGDLLFYHDAKLKKLKRLPMIDSHLFLKDSLFCEWAYIVNLDDKLLEVYKGFNKKYDPTNRYAKFNYASEYQAVRLFATIPIDDELNADAWLQELKDLEAGQNEIDEAITVDFRRE